MLPLLLRVSLPPTYPILPLGQAALLRQREMNKEAKQKIRMKLMNPASTMLGAGSAIGQAQREELERCERQERNSAAW